MVQRDPAPDRGSISLFLLTDTKTLRRCDVAVFKAAWMVLDHLHAGVTRLQEGGQPLAVAAHGLGQGVQQILGRDAVFA
jgi:hypothetical protein